MIKFELDEKTSVLHVRPVGPLRKEDFDELAHKVDPFIERSGGLAGLLLEAKQFPGWEDFGAAARHFRFVRDHHRKIAKIAVVTDSPIGTLAEHLASHFVAAQIKRFPAGQGKAARDWIASAEAKPGR
jgi:hypothetical protein